MRFCFASVFGRCLVDVGSILGAKRHQTSIEKSIENATSTKTPTKMVQETQQGSMVGTDPSHFDHRNGRPLKAGLNPSSLAGLRLRSRLVHFLTLSDTGSHMLTLAKLSDIFSHFLILSFHFCSVSAISILKENRCMKTRICFGRLSGLHNAQRTTTHYNITQRTPKMDPTWANMEAKRDQKR